MFFYSNTINKQTTNQGSRAIFSGNIRDYARFKAGFDTIVMSYFDPVYQVYVLKETCLQGQAGSLVCNLENIADI